MPPDFPEWALWVGGFGALLFIVCHYGERHCRKQREDYDRYLAAWAEAHRRENERK